jgi:Dynamin central region
MVYKELREIVSRIDLVELNRYQKLKYKICDVMECVLDQCLTPTTEMIMNLVEIENAHINTNHPDFVGSADTLLNLFGTQEEQIIQPFQENPKQVSLLDQKGGRPSQV